MIIKVDLEKAYDRLEWSFVEKTLIDVGLPSKLVHAIMSCISSASFKLLWNGESTDSIVQKRGIRQGDPLSPYIFVLCLERLGHKIQNEVSLGRWKPLKASRNGPSVSHLFFADDLLLFADATVSQMEVVKRCLAEFEHASGQKVSFSKSIVHFSSNTLCEEAAEISLMGGMPLTEDLGRYLGMYLVHGHHGKQHYKSLLERVHKRLNGRKMKTLSLAGRATLASSIMLSMPIYQMQTAKMLN